MTNNNGYIPTEEEVLKEIEEYYAQRPGPRLDEENKVKGLERLFKEVLHEKAWEAPNHSTEDAKPLGLDSEHSVLEN